MAIKQRGNTTFKETAVARLLRAAKRAEVPCRLDIGKDGSFSLIPIAEPQVETVAPKLATELQSWD
jgi:hypothetical protein